ncbi:MAG TPA: DUF2007 domain-containing protein [Candidatus Aminicenantes bacterium]|nr:DUF2007 domain-containing protein [Candidatus Aminicenantes bacterium]
MSEDDLEELAALEGGIEAEIVKSKLESFGIPVLLRYEAAGRIFGITLDGLGKVRVMVPRRLLAEARQVLADKADHAGSADGGNGG